MLMKVLSYKGKILSHYVITDEGDVFSGRRRDKVNPFMKNSEYYFNLIVNDKVVAVEGKELVLSNFVEKPKDVKSEARFNKSILGLSKPLAVENLYWGKVDTTKTEKSPTASSVELMGMKSVFISGVLTGLLINEAGELFTQQGKPVKPLISRRGKPYIERALPYGLGVRSVMVADIVVENYLLPAGDFLENYHVSYVDGDRRNCAKRNLALWPEGHSGIARKKAVKVFKDGVFFGAFDSVKKCAAIIDIPRRRISEIIKEGKAKNGFEVMPILR